MEIKNYDFRSDNLLENLVYVDCDLQILNKEKGGSIIPITKFHMSNEVIWAIQNNGIIYVLQSKADMIKIKSSI